MIDIKPVGKNQAEQLANLQADTFRQAYSNVHSTEDLEAYCLAHYTPKIAEVDLSSAETVCCMGYINAEPSGYYMVKHRDCPITLETKSSELKQIYVLSSAYGKGLGSALFDHAIASVRASGSERVWLCVSDINYRAQAFYTKLGFTKVGVGPILQVGKDSLTSSVLIKAV